MYGEWAVKLGNEWLEYRCSESRARQTRDRKGGQLYMVTREQVATLVN